MSFNLNTDVATESVVDVTNESHEPRVYTVSDLNRGIKDTLEAEFPLVWVQGEISNFKAHTSGHYYFSLKDNKAQINAVMFKGFNSRLKFRPESGMEVLVRARVTVYEPRGNYQVFCEVMEPVGAGALQIAFEQLKKKLAAEGLFDSERKRALPVLPGHILIITSPTGAAIQDMLNVLGRRHRGAKITLIPAMVQGDAAPQSLVKALAMVPLFTDADVVIIGRGGGSIEDLWAFNSEDVARAIAACPLPIVSAVGHEVDVTIADYVADLRAPTPSAAAELVVKNAADIVERLREIKARLLMAQTQKFRAFVEKLKFLRVRLVDPKRRLEDLAQRLDDLSVRLALANSGLLQKFTHRLKLLAQRLPRLEPIFEFKRLRLEAVAGRLQQGIQHQLQNARQSFRQAVSRLDTLSPLKVLNRGYGVVVHNEQVIQDPSHLAVGNQFDVVFARGRVTAQVQDVDLHFELEKSL